MAISQSEAAALFLPVIKTKGKHYIKFREVVARPGVVGEEIVTVTSTGVETKNTVQPSGGVVVRNLTGAGEEYIVKPETFAKRYLEVEGEAPEGYKRYKPCGECDAIIYDPAEFGNLTELTASWGETQPLVKGDAVATIGDGQVYRIAEAEFGETYR